MRTYLKTVARMFKRHFTRFLSVVLMVLIAVGFISGIGASKDKIDYSMIDYYKARTVSDFIIKSKSDEGFSGDDAAKAETLLGGATVDTGVSVDLSVGEKRSLRLYFLDFDNWNVNVPDIVKGERATDPAQIYAERSDNVIKGYEVGDEIVLDFKEILIKLSEQNGAQISAEILRMLDRLKPVNVTVCGIVQSPLTFARDGEPSYNNPPDLPVQNTTTGTKDMDVLENILFISKTVIPTYKDAVSFLPDDMNEPFLKDGDLYVAVQDRNRFNAFSADYKSYAEKQKAELKESLADAEILTLYDNYSFNSLKSYGEKVENIGYVLMVAFLFVTALVVLSTMIRLIEEERSQIACLKTLGYSSAGIISKYILFALIATGIGGAGAYFVGIGLMRLIYFVFNYSFCMPPISAGVVVVFYIIAFAVIVAGSLLATAIAGIKMTNERPADLLRPKPPKAGKKVLLEKIPFIWNKLPFRFKSTVRNVLRYKSRFIMTVVAVALSASLVLAGLGLLDLCLFHDFGSPAIMGIAAVVVAFAGLLTAVVIYTLTNINISERNREIATLMVLGYHDGEVSGYIYREIFINSLIGIVFGYPASLFLLWLVFSTMGLGSIGGVTWFWWLIMPFVVLAFTGLIMLVLRRKIVKIDMNQSLKALE